MSDSITEHPGRCLWLSLLAWVSLFVAVFVRGMPPAPKGADAIPDMFSASRAKGILDDILLDVGPHPTGSAPNDLIRSRIRAKLERLGYQVEIQSGFMCGQWGVCAEIKNILARRPALDEKPTVLVAAHYDSVPAGPGASDDGAGVAAVIEIARALTEGEQCRHQVILLLDDGEELGLLGAKLFVSASPWAKNIRAAVNLEARGTSGPSLMFETGSANRWSIDLYSKSVARPLTSSIYYAIYKTLPSDTDLTVFKKAGYQGFGFAFIGDAAHYHTAADSTANLDLRSIQSQGDNALAVIRALANNELEGFTESEAVYFDLFSLCTVRWPAQWTLALAIAGAIFLIAGIGLCFRFRELTLRSWFWGLLYVPGTLFVAYIAGDFLFTALRWADAVPVVWVAHPFAGLFASSAAGLFVAISFASLLGSRAGFCGLWVAVWTWWTLGSIVLALRAPQVSYVFLVPAGFASLILVLRRVCFPRMTSWSEVMIIIPMVTAAILALSAIWFFYDGLGVAYIRSNVTFVALMMTPVAPLVGTMPWHFRRLFSYSLLVLLFTGFLAALLVSPYSTQARRHFNIAYVKDDDTKTTLWVADTDSGTLPRNLLGEGKFNRQSTRAFAWNRGGQFVANAPYFDLAAPKLTILDSSHTAGVSAYHILVRSFRNSRVITILFPISVGIESLSMNGQPLPNPPPGSASLSNDWVAYTCVTVPTDGIDLSIVLRSAAPIDLYLMDQTPGFPGGSGNYVLGTREDDSEAFGDGNTTVVARRERLSQR